MNAIQKFNAILDERIKNASGFNTASAYLIVKQHFNQLFNIAAMQQDIELMQAIGRRIRNTPFPEISQVTADNMPVDNVMFLNRPEEETQFNKSLVVEIPESFFLASLAIQLWLKHSFVKTTGNSHLNFSEFMVEVAKLPEIALHLDRLKDKTPAMQCRKLYQDLQDYQYIHVVA